MSTHTNSLSKEIPLRNGFLFHDPDDKSWHVQTEKGIFPLHPDDVEDPMMLLKSNSKIAYGFVEDHKIVPKHIYCKIIRFV